MRASGRESASRFWSPCRDPELRIAERGAQRLLVGGRGGQHGERARQVRGR